MTTQYTPALWHVLNDDVYYYRVFDDKHYCIASCGKNPVDKANATFIAAAPIVMEALLNLLDEYSSAGLQGKAGLEACKAIAIAKGEL
jgi:hypothetical protein